MNCQRERAHTGAMIQMELKSPNFHTRVARSSLQHPPFFENFNLALVPLITCSTDYVSSLKLSVPDPRGGGVGIFEPLPFSRAGDACDREVEVGHLDSILLRSEKTTPVSCRFAECGVAAGVAVAARAH